MTTATEPIAISLTEAARLLGCSAEHLRRLALDGERFGAYRMGHRWLVHRDRLLAYIEEQQDSLAPSIPSAAVTPPSASARTSGVSQDPGAIPPGISGPGSPSPSARPDAPTGAAIGSVVGPGGPGEGVLGGEAS